jgi:predicted RNA-binding Zn-ribbon protein involved in translation (DUF1610 family)
VIPASGPHAGHQLKGGFCLDCNHPLTRADYRSVACPLCGAEPQVRCADEDGARDAVHEEHMWTAHGHDPSEFEGLRARRLQNAREARKQRGSRRR